MTRRQALAITAAASPLAALAGCRSRQSTGQVRLVISGSASVLGYLPHALAQQLGFYREQALSLRMENLLGAPKALMGGSADVVVGYFDHPVRITALGRTVKAFAVLARCPGAAIVSSGRTLTPIRHITDLKGRLVGIPGRGGALDFFAKYLLTRNGLSLNDVRLVPVGSSASAFAALEQGKVDAWSGTDPGVTRFHRRYPESVILADARTADGLEQCTGSREQAGAVLYATAEWLDKNASTARRLARAIQQALQWIHAHTAEEIARKVPPNFYGSDLEGYVQALEKAKNSYSRDGHMSHEAASSVHRMLAASVETVRIAQLDLSKTYTNTFLAADPVK